MGLDHLVGGLRSWLDDYTTPTCALMLGAESFIDEKMPPYMHYGMGGLLVWRLLRNIAAHHFVARRIKQGWWDNDLLEDHVTQINTHHYVRRHPEYRPKLDALLRTTGRIR